MKFSSIALLVFGLVFVFGSQEDYNDEVRQQTSYCENVKSGIWPDFQGTFEKECK